DLDPCRGGGQRTGVPKIAGYRRDAGAREVRSRFACTIPHQRRDVVARRRQGAREVSPSKAGGTGYEDAHRSATSVTGDPNGFSRPARSSLSSDQTVKRRDPIALCSAIGSTNCRCTERIRKPLRSNASATARCVKARYGSVALPRACVSPRQATSIAATLRADG